MTLIQSAIGTSATTTVAATFASAPTSGNLLVAGVMNTDNFATTPSGWAVIQRGDFGGIELYHKVSNGSETTLTITLGGAGSGSALMMAEFAHDGTASPIDVSTSAGSGTSNVSSQTTGTTATTTRATELAIACIGWGGGSNASSPGFTNTWTNSFTRVAAPAERLACGVTLAYRDLSATGAYSTAEGAAVANKMQGIIATFKVNVAVIPDAPTSNAATSARVDNFVANWTVAGTGGTPTGYRLDVATDSGFTSLVSGYNDLDVGLVTTYNVAGLNPSTTYYYRVRAYNSAGTSASSGTQSTTTVARQLPFRVGTDPLGGATTRVLGGTQVAATTTVSADLQLAWNVRANVAQTKQLAWNVRAAVAQTKQASWNVRTTIAQTKQLAWHVRSIAGQSQQSSWLTRALAGQSRQLAWHTRSLVTQSKQLAWNVRSIAGQSKQFSWNVRALATKLQQSSWHVRAIVAKSQQASWHVRAIVFREQQASWNVLSAVLTAGQNLQLAWQVRSLVSAQQASSWHTRQAVARTQQVAWHTRSLVSRDLQLAWNVYEIVVLVPVGRDLTIAWHVRAIVGKDQQLAWNVLAGVLIIGAWGEFSDRIARGKTKRGTNVAGLLTETEHRATVSKTEIKGSFDG